MNKGNKKEVVLLSTGRKIASHQNPRKYKQTPHPSLAPLTFINNRISCAGLRLVRLGVKVGVGDGVSKKIVDGENDDESARKLRTTIVDIGAGRVNGSGVDIVGVDRNSVERTIGVGWSNDSVKRAVDVGSSVKRALNVGGGQHGLKFAVPLKSYKAIACRSSASPPAKSTSRDRQPTKPSTPKSNDIGSPFGHGAP